MTVVHEVLRTSPGTYEQKHTHKSKKEASQADVLVPLCGRREGLHTPRARCDPINSCTTSEMATPGFAGFYCDLFNPVFPQTAVVPRPLLPTCGFALIRRIVDR